MTALFNPRQEKFLTIEISEDKTKAILLGLSHDRKLTPINIWDDFKAEDFLRKRRWILKKWNIIAVADSSLTSIANLSASLERNSGDGPLTPVELENFLGKTVGRVFNQCREKASKELATDDHNTILISGRVVSVRVDGHQVIDPIGFPVKKIQISIELIFITRQLYEKLKSLFGVSRSFSFADWTRTQFSVLGKIYHSPLNLLFLRSDGSTLFTFESSNFGNTVYKHDVDWSIDSFAASLSELWGVSRPVAETICRVYAEKDASPRFMKHVSQIFNKAVLDLLGKASRKNHKGRVLTVASREMPIALPKSYKKIQFNALDSSLVLNKLGFTINLSDWKTTKESEIFSHLAPFLRFYYDKDDGTINHWLKRRLNWLGVVAN